LQDDNRNTAEKTIKIEYLDSIFTNI